MNDLTKYLALGGFFLSLLFSVNIFAYDVNQHLNVYGYLQSWITLYEQNEKVSGVTQNITNDEAVDIASGFSLRRMRMGTNVYLFDKTWNAKAEFKAEGGLGLLEYYINYKPYSWLSMFFGQFKVPTCYESLQSNTGLNFIERTRIASVIVDYALSRTLGDTHPFSVIRTNFRDFGFGIKGNWNIPFGQLGYFVMISNGLGKDLFIGGPLKEQFIVSNQYQFFYGIRLEFRKLWDRVSLGGHYSFNEHDDMVAKDDKSVYDLHRYSYSGDIQLHFPEAGLEIAGMFAGGAIKDDFNADGRTDLDYYGWEVKTLLTLNTMMNLLAGMNVSKDHLFQIGFRFDNLSQEKEESGTVVKHNDYTIGINYLYQNYMKWQLNYIIRRSQPQASELKDDVLLMNLQFSL